MKKITGTLMYIQLQTPVKAYVDPKKPAGTPPNPDEWKAQVLVDEDTADAYEAYATSINAKSRIKKIKAAEFEDKFNMELPEELAGEKNVFMITLTKSTELGLTGKPVPPQYRPVVYEQIGNTRMDITATKLVGNGSKGAISLDIFNKDDGTARIGLKNVLVTELVEYEAPPPVVNDGSEFEEDDTPAPAPVKEAAKPAATKKGPAAKKVVAKQEEDEDAPF